MEKTISATKIKLSDVQTGDIFSEVSHYIVLKTGRDFQFKHLESNNVLTLDEAYVANLLESADQYDTEVEVGVEDKYWTKKQIEDGKADGTIPSDSDLRVGDLKLKGIRNIWADIHSSQVWAVSYNKKDKNMTKKDLAAARLKQAQEAVANSLKIGLDAAIKEIQENPISGVIAGEERILRGYKTQFTSTNGAYDVVDMDISTEKGESNVRSVNINEINWLVFGGVKYVVKK